MRYSKCEICAACRGKVMIMSTPVGENSVYKFGELYCYGKYVGVLRERFIAYKFRKQMWLGAHFGRMMHSAFRRSLENNPPDVVTYVPISGSRLCERGFNQSKEMARTLAKGLGVPCKAFLASQKSNTVQSKLGRNKRLSGVHGRFVIKEDAEGLCGKRVLLVDDIFTTGSTINECAQLLKDLGATAVDGMVFATGRADLE